MKYAYGKIRGVFYAAAEVGVSHVNMYWHVTPGGFVFQLTDSGVMTVSSVC